jgi:ACS family hexuronate transporter-like MFS transporter
MKIPYLRWWIAALLVAASVLNYLDRAALGFAATQIKAEFHLNDGQYGQINSFFLAAYTLSYLFGGMLVDRLGTRRSFLITVACWSAANMAHALAHSLGDLMAFRFLLGLWEAAFYPAAMRACAEWFLPEDRSKPIGLFLGGASFGAVIAPIVMAGMMEHPGIGWRGGFVLSGGAGFLLLPVWYLVYRLPSDHPNLTEPEREYLARDPLAAPEKTGKWDFASVLRNPYTARLVVVRGLTDAAWYILLLWLGKYFREVRGWDNRHILLYLWIPYAAADLGALTGGWVSSGLIRRGVPSAKVRAACVLGFCALLPASLAGFFMPTAGAALACLSVATFGHMAFGTNNLALHTDLYPSRSVGTIMGITGAAGALAGIGAQLWVGHSIDVSKSYFYLFLTTACLHPIAAVILASGLRTTAARRPV